MILNKDTILADPALAGLTEEQATAIETLATLAIEAKTRDYYKNWDKDLFESTGKEKGGTEKTYNYHKRLWKETLDELNQLKAEKEALEAKVAAGTGDEALKKQLHDKEAEIASLKKLHQAETEGLTSKLQEFEKNLSQKDTDFELQIAVSGLSFKPADVLPDDVRKPFVSTKIQEILSSATMDKDENGNTIWRDKDGEILRNPKNKNTPFTTKELVEEKLSPILAESRTVTGAGAGPGQPNPRSGAKFTAKTQVEFTEQASEYLLKSGVERGSSKFNEELGKLRTEHNVKSLPMQ